MKINKQSGLPLQIYIPNLQTIQPFEFEFYTNSTAPKTTNIVVSYDGTTYIDCAPWEKGVYLYTEKKLSNDGDLFCRATYNIPSPVVPGGVQKVVIDNISTGISIVSKGGDYFDPISEPSKLKTPSFNDPLCSHIPIFMTFYPGAEKGESGKDGVAGIDYSLLSEQIVPGEYFVGSDGARKQVYGRLFKGTLPAPNINATTTRIILRSIDTMLWCHAFYINNEYSDQLQITFYVTGGNQLVSYISFATESSATNNTGQPYYAYCKYTKQ